MNRFLACFLVLASVALVGAHAQRVGPNEYQFTTKVFIGLNDLDFFWSVERGEMKGALVTRDDGWFALGFSETGVGMAGLDVIFCDGENRITDRHASDYGLPEIDASQDLTVAEVSVDGRYRTARFARLLDTGDSDDIAIDASKPGWIAFAMGDVDETGAEQMHTTATRRYMEVDLAAGWSEGAGRPWQVTHGVVMGLTWGLLVPLSVLASAVVKKFFDWWFPVHWVLAGGAALLTVAGAAYAFVSKQRNGEPHLDSAHTWAGALLVLSVLMQVAIGLWAHLAWNPRRLAVPVQDKMHRWLGRATAVLGAATAIMGLYRAGYLGVGVSGYTIIPTLTAMVLLGVIFASGSLVNRQKTGQHVALLDENASSTL